MTRRQAITCLLAATACASEPAKDSRAVRGKSGGVAQLASREVTAVTQTPTLRFVSGPLTVELTGQRAVLHGDCPTECCRYGEWTIGTTVPILDRPDSSARVVATSTNGMAVHTDSGVVAYDTAGLVVATHDTVLEARAELPGARLAIASGDTLVLLSEGEGGFMFLWRGKVGMELVVDDSPSAAVRMARRPSAQQWWAYVTSKSSPPRGWIDVNRANVHGADACGSAPLFDPEPLSL
jgi:hypothetical protein